MTNFLKASYHSIDRAIERLDTNEKTATKNISLALERGKDATQFTSKERAYLERVAKGNASAIAYNNYCYILNENGFCITMFALPEWFGKKRHYDGKKEIRNLRSYTRNNLSKYEHHNCAYA